MPSMANNICPADHTHRILQNNFCPRLFFLAMFQHIFMFVHKVSFFTSAEFQIEDIATFNGRITVHCVVKAFKFHLFSYSNKCDHISVLWPFTCIRIHLVKPNVSGQLMNVNTLFKLIKSPSIFLGIGIKCAFIVSKNLKNRPINRTNLEVEHFFRCNMCSIK